MTDLSRIIPPNDFDAQEWVDRWDKMQERYLVRRSERFDVMVHMIGGALKTVSRVLDLGCGTGSLMLSILRAFPQAEVYGIDFDPTLLWLAEARLSSFPRRATVVLADLRDVSWPGQVPKPIDAVISATALHWLRQDELSKLYDQIASVIREGGIFLNADHVGSDCPEIQEAWESHRARMRSDEAKADTCESSSSSWTSPWKSFWNAYSQALALNIKETRQRVIGGWEGGIENGLPLAWHIDRLRERGFVYVDCFWRCDCDAIYGGIKKSSNAERAHAGDGL